jgi:hypothetical protein
VIPVRLGDLLARIRPPRRPRTAKPPPPPPSARESELSDRRDQLAERFAEQQWDLGGIVYEMAIRDHFRLDVVVRHAARLQEVDTELAEVERMLRLEEAGAAGACPSCGALYARGAVYCWRCGKDLIRRETISAAGAPQEARESQPIAEAPVSAGPPPEPPPERRG